MRQAAREVVHRLRQAGFEAYWVGGCVRDLLLGHEPLDFDVATAAQPEEVTPLFAATREVGRSFAVLQVRCQETWIQVATFRSEAAYSDGRHPDRVAYADVRQDALRRDFTINALFMDPETGRILDFVGGQEDLRRRLLRCVGNAQERLREDALRLLRAVRFTCRFELQIEASTRAALEAEAPRLALVAAERIREEWLAMLLGPQPRRAMELLRETGLLAHVAPELERLVGCAQSPELHPEGDVWEHTLRMLQHMRQDSDDALFQADEALALGVVWHDVGKPETRQRHGHRVVFHGHEKRGMEIAAQSMRRLAVAARTQEAVQMLVGQHLRFIDVFHMRRSTLRRFVLQDGFERLLQLHRLDALASRGDLTAWEFCRRERQTLQSQNVSMRPFLDGRELMARGYAPGPRLGTILRALVDAQLEGQVRQREEALAWVREHFDPDDVAPSGD